MPNIGEDDCLLEARLKIYHLRNSTLSLLHKKMQLFLPSIQNLSPQFFSRPVCDMEEKLLSEYIDKYLKVEDDRPNDHLSLFEAERFQVRAFGSPTTYRLVHLADSTLELEEATFTIHGVILDKEFPPISDIRCNRRRNDHFATYIRQYVALTGFELESFNKVLCSLGRIHQHFADSLPAGGLEDFQQVSVDGLASLACHTRYFTPRRSCQTSVHQPFGPGVDPNGTLERLKGSAYIHTEDNMVQYLGKKESDNGTCYQNINPARFQKGDIVEIVVSFFCILTRSNKYKMMTSLKSIFMLNDKVREKARDERMKIAPSTKEPSRTLKRRLVPTDDEGALVKKYARMALS